MLKCREKASECLKYGKAFGGLSSAPDPAGEAYDAIFHNLTANDLCRM